MLVLAGRGLASTHAVVLGIRGLLQREVDAAFAGLLRQVWISDQVEAELLAILFETVKFVQDGLRLIVLILVEHRVDLRGLRHDFGRIEARLSGRLLLYGAHEHTACADASLRR